jgi:lysine 2,3-aminomutase
MAPSLSRTARSLEDLVAAGALDSQSLTGSGGEALRAVASQFAIAVTPEVLANMASADPEADPIARQFVPTAAEGTITPQERADPIGDEAHSPVKGIVHRYPDRVLLKLLHVCPVYCRFCFRREMVGPGGEGLDPAETEAALAYIREQPQIREVILTGGDPLMLSPRRLAEVLQALDAMPHVGVVRIHSRVPVTDSARITPELVSALQLPRAAIWVALHCNHARELTPAAVAALRRLSLGGIPLVSQTVLLRGVNNDAETLEALFRALVEARVKPYYLHHPDLAHGTGHFRLGVAEGQALVRALRGRISGLCQPTYVIDIPGGYGKAPAGPCYVDVGTAGADTPEAVIEDWRGERHDYHGR